MRSSWTLCALPPSLRDVIVLAQAGIGWDSLRCCGWLFLLYLRAWENSQFYWFDNYRELCAYLIDVSHLSSCICIKLKCKYGKCRRTRQIFAQHPKTDWQPESERERERVHKAIAIWIEIGMETETATGIKIGISVAHSSVARAAQLLSHWPHLHAAQAADPCPLGSGGRCWLARNRGVIRRLPTIQKGRQRRQRQRTKDQMVFIATFELSTI